MRTSGAATPAEVTAQIDGSAAKSPVTTKKAAADFVFDSVFDGYAAATQDKLSLSAFPAFGTSTGQYYKPAMLISASAHSAHAQAAAQLINFLVNDPGAGKDLGTSRGLPPNLMVRQVMTPDLPDAKKTIVTYEQTVEKQLSPTPTAPPKGDGQVQTLFQRTYQDVAFGKVALPAAVDQFFTQGQQDISG
jgi:multiple sugar transport system substrate-binding protein